MLPLPSCLDGNSLEQPWRSGAGVTGPWSCQSDSKTLSWLFSSEKIAIFPGPGPDIDGAGTIVPARQTAHPTLPPLLSPDLWEGLGAKKGFASCQR